MVIWILVLLVAVLLVAAIWYRQHSRRQPVVAAPAEPEIEPIKTFRCVGVAYDEKTCCSWIQQLDGARLLPYEARLFPLPLPECDAARCTCRYVHFADRRFDDRRAPFSGMLTAFRRNMGAERRSGEDRRSDYVSQEMQIIEDYDFDIEILKTS